MAAPLRAAIAMLALIATPVHAADSATVDRFMRLSDSFSEQLARSPLAGMSPVERRARAVCILNDFEDLHGGAGLSALMEMMDVLATGAQFDDQTIVDFNNRFGPDYDRVEMTCTRAQRGS